MTLEGTDTPDYQTAIEGAALSGRQVTTGLYDSTLLGENAGRVRPSPMPGGMLPIRHAELQAVGKKNPEIFRLIADELGRRLVAAPLLSERQLRRIVYG